MDSTKWWSKDTVAVVTGSNQGIGFEIVRGLASQGITTVLTARNEERGSAACAALRSDGLESVVFHTLDITIPESIENFATWLEKTYGGLDILVNNAAILIRASELEYDMAKKTLDTNYFGVQRVIDRLFPLLRPSPHGARIINVSSTLGQFCNFNFGTTEQEKKLRDVDNLNLEKLDSLAVEWLESTKSPPPKWASKSHFAYSESKLLLNLYSRILARSIVGRSQGQKIYLNCMCPGFVSTNINGYTGHLTPREGAVTGVWLALLPQEDLFHGKFVRRRVEIDW